MAFSPNLKGQFKIFTGKIIIIFFKYQFNKFLKKKVQTSVNCKLPFVLVGIILYGRGFKWATITKNQEKFKRGFE